MGPVGVPPPFFLLFFLKNYDIIYIENVKKGINMKHNIRVFCTGDVHRHDNERFYQFDHIKDELQNSINYVIVLGDFGLNYYNNISDDLIKKFYNRFAEDYNFTFIAVRGNHELKPESLSNYKEIYKNEDGLTGRFLIEDNYPRLLFCYTYGQFTIGNKSFYQIGGAYSVDKFHRLRIGGMWTPDEQLTDEEKITCEKDIVNYPINYMLSHTCPLKWVPTYLFLGEVNQKTVDNTTEIWLDRIEESITYDKWYFGHYHGNEIINDKAEILFNQIKEIEI